VPASPDLLLTPLQQTSTTDSGRERYFDSKTWKECVKRLKAHLPHILSLRPVTDSDSTVDPTDRLVQAAYNWNRHTLQTKLEILLRPVPVLFTTDAGRATFPRRVADTRHYLSHYSESMRNRAMKGDTLRRATIGCWMILTYWLAHLVDAPVELARSLTARAQHPSLLADVGQAL